MCNNWEDCDLLIYQTLADAPYSFSKLERGDLEFYTTGEQVNILAEFHRLLKRTRLPNLDGSSMYAAADESLLSF